MTMFTQGLREIVQTERIHNLTEARVTMTLTAGLKEILHEATTLIRSQAEIAAKVRTASQVEVQAITQEATASQAEAQATTLLEATASLVEAQATIRQGVTHNLAEVLQAVHHSPAVLAKAQEEAVLTTAEDVREEEDNH